MSVITALAVCPDASVPVTGTSYLSPVAVGGTSIVNSTGAVSPFRVTCAVERLSCQGKPPGAFVERETSPAYP